MGAYRHNKNFSSDSFQYVIEIDFQLSSFSEYIRLTEEMVEKEIKQKIKEHELFLKNADEQDMQYHEFDDHEIKINTQRLYYNSLFISLYSFLEKKMYQLCKLAENHHSIKVKDLSDEGVFKYHKYLKKVACIDLDKLNPEWTEITKYNKLRNLLVHSPTTELENSENNQRQINILKSIKGLTYTERYGIFDFSIQGKQVLIDFQGIISKFLNEIYYEKVVF